MKKSYAERTSSLVVDVAFWLARFASLTHLLLAADHVDLKLWPRVWRRHHLRNDAGHCGKFFHAAPSKMKRGALSE